LDQRSGRSSIAGGANYEEARCAESRADFAHKCNVAGKEVRESVYWLRVIGEAGLSRSPKLEFLVREGKRTDGDPQGLGQDREGTSRVAVHPFVFVFVFVFALDRIWQKHP